MESITISRDLPASPEEIRPLVEDVEPFMRAAGFETVDRDGDRLRIGKGFALASIELDLRLLDVPEAVLAYEQHEGIFDSMRTEYVLDATDEGAAITATTEFALDVDVVGGILDSTVVRRQRTRELTAQFDYLEARLSESH